MMKAPAYASGSVDAGRTTDGGAITARWAFLTNHVRNVEVCPLSLLTERSVQLPLLARSCHQISAHFSRQKY